MNPCPCGYYGDSKRECRCSTRQIKNYWQKISGPLLDRIDLHVEAPLVDFRELSSNTNTGEKSESIRSRVTATRQIQTRRFKNNPNSTNSAMGSRLVRQHCWLDPESTRCLKHAMEEMNFRARAHNRILLLIGRIRSKPTFVKRLPDLSTGNSPACLNQENPTITVPI